ncbi:MAG: tRNA (adenosine(37)-N6)-dimethylallyltransferase MiaA [Bacteroidetes bacterium MED-G21]|nr:MAG: tRNA (adenosine(37)-N6)-dimethylallyltransferase MiaA [Bacteroidetes bacterium MED-G21]
MDKYLILIAGPTAVGKTQLSLSIAEQYKTDIISCDSRQFYKEMCIGTAVPNADELSKIKHHFIQNLSIEDNYSIGQFERDALAKIEALHKNNNMIVMVGGSGMYIDAVCKGLDDFPPVPDSIREELNLRHQNEGLDALKKELMKLDPDYYELADSSNPHRIIRAIEICMVSGKPFSSFRKQQAKKRNFKTVKIILNRDREELYSRINKRVDRMIKEGLLEEVKNLYNYKDYNALQTVGYKELFAYYDGDWDLETAIEEIKKNTRRYAKRQMTWFRRDTQNVFFNPDKTSEIIAFVEKNTKN